MKKKILVVVIGIQRAQEHEWYVQMLNRELFEIEFALINSRNSYMADFLVANGIKAWHYNYAGKSDLFKLIGKLFIRILKGKYNVVHTHLFESGLAGLIASYLARTPTRILTRHYSDYHHVWFPQAVKYDKLMNYLATDIIAISQNVKNILINSESVSADKIRLIYHGIKMDDYEPGAVGNQRIDRIREKYSITGNGPVIGAISRYTELKGLQYLIPAFSRLLKDFPSATLVLANATGDYKEEIKNLLNQLPSNSYREIEFENDIAALYRVFDCFVHIPVNATAEAFGQTYIEALASEIPSVFTLSGVAPEFAVNKVNCFVVSYCDSEAVYNTITHILFNKHKLETILENGYNIVKEKFDVKIKIRNLEKLYLNSL